MSLFVYSGFKWMNDPQLDLESICTIEGARAAASDLADFVIDAHPYKTAVELPYEFPFLFDFAQALVVNLVHKSDHSRVYGIGMWEKDVPTFQLVADSLSFLELPKS